MILCNIKYGEHERQVFDIYLPEETERRNGIVIGIHGGAWTSGHKELYVDMGTDLSGKGFALAAINYRYLSDDSDMSAILADITASLAQIKKTGSEYGFDFTRCLMTGGSAGGHLSLLYPYMVGGNAPIESVAAVSFCPPADLRNRRYIFGNRLGNEKQMSDLMGKIIGRKIEPEDYEKYGDELFEYSPLKYVTNAVPSAIGHGAVDSVVPFEDTVELVKKLDELNIEHDFVIYPHSDHDLKADPEADKEMYRLLYDYIEKYL